jgi:lysophospholipase L1-like esterase
VNFGIGSDTTVGVLKRLPKYQSLERASLCVMAIGVNDLHRRGNQEILENYSLILQAIPSYLPIVFSAILPVNEFIRNDLAGKNKCIIELNSGLKNLCETKSPKCIFIDLGRNFVDLSGNLKNEYQEGDGVHLNGAGNTILIQELKKKIRDTQQAVIKDDKNKG